MHKPLIRYLVSSPYGNEPVDKNKIDFPLETDPLRTPYRVYFDSIRNFLTREESKPLLNAVSQKLKRDVLLEKIDGIIIRTEKHGALYHPASVELILDEEKVKFGLNVALTETGRNWLREEFYVLKNLQRKYDLSYLPDAYLFDNVDSTSFLLEEWFEGYHEFHIAANEKGGHSLKLWEFGSGYKCLTSRQSCEIYKQASKILTLYYDLADFRHIYPWHHAAGDFVAKMENGKIDVRLTTARRYEPLMDFDKDKVNPLFALFYFFLLLSLKMRLDKVDGMNEVIWAGDHSAEATVTGFFEALRLKEEKENHPGVANEFLHLIKSFSREDLKVSSQALIDLFSGTGDLPVVTAKLDGHVEKLFTVLQNLPLQ
jgi:hypothetical protein